MLLCTSFENYFANQVILMLLALSQDIHSGKDMLSLPINISLIHLHSYMFTITKGEEKGLGTMVNGVSKMKKSGQHVTRLLHSALSRVGWFQSAYLINLEKSHSPPKI